MLVSLQHFSMLSFILKCPFFHFSEGKVSYIDTMTLSRTCVGHSNFLFRHKQHLQRVSFQHVSLPQQVVHRAGSIQLLLALDVTDLFLLKYLRVEVEEGECFPHHFSEDRPKDEFANTYLCL